MLLCDLRDEHTCRKHKIYIIIKDNSAESSHGCVLDNFLEAIAIQKIMNVPYQYSSCFYKNNECISLYLQCRRHGLNSTWLVHSNASVNT